MPFRSRIYRETLEAEKAQRSSSIPGDVRRAQDFDRASLLGGSEGQELANLDDPQRTSSAQPIQFRTSACSLESTRD